MKSQPDIVTQEAFYDQRWKDFTFANNFKLARCAAILDALASLGLPQPRIVDLGCGAGWLSNILGTFGPTTGIDLSKKAMLAAAERYPHVQFIGSDILQWQYRKESCDVVVSQEVIEHLEDQRAYLDVAFNLLRPGGHLILTTPNAHVAEMSSGAAESGSSDQPLENWLTVKQLKSLLQVRFEIIRLTTVIPVSGGAGIHRLLTSVRVRNLAEKIGLGKLLSLAQAVMQCGLHTVVIAKKPQV
jgi:2-polyprenyl-3-methyl-5-hydroxy-6-metoxy-1,4-benzoquinol methylase